MIPSGEATRRDYSSVMSHDHATVAEEEYLQSHLLAAGGRAAHDRRQRGARHAGVGADGARDDRPAGGRRLHHARPSDKSLSFTDTGREHAEGIVRRHRLIERFLTDVFDIPWDQVHEEAEKLEHWMSPTVEERMLKAIGDVKTCPHGHPIFTEERIEGVPLADVEVGAKVTVLRFENEAEDLLHYLMDAGLTPGLKGTLSDSGDEEVAFEADGKRYSVTRSVAETVSVLADPSPPTRTALPEHLVSGQGDTGAARPRRAR